MLRRLVVAALLAAPVVPASSASACGPTIRDCLPATTRCVIVIPGTCDECPDRCLP